MITSRRISMRAMVTRTRSFEFPTARLFPVSCRGRRHASYETGRWRAGANLRKIGGVPEGMRSWSEWQVPMPSDFPMVDVLKVRPLEGHRLWLRFTDGSEGMRDLSDLIAGGGPMVQPLKAQDYFIAYL